jgi:hypothetical protein
MNLRRNTDECALLVGPSLIDLEDHEGKEEASKSIHDRTEDGRRRESDGEKWRSAPVDQGSSDILPSVRDSIPFPILVNNGTQRQPDEPAQPPSRFVAVHSDWKGEQC